jgi:hypothetical protein
MAHHKTEKKSKGMESKAGKLKIHGGFKAEEHMKGEHKKEHKKG